MGVLLELHGTHAYNHCQELHAFKYPKASTESITWQSILILNAHDLEKTQNKTPKKATHKKPHSPLKNPHKTQKTQTNPPDP